MIFGDEGNKENKLSGPFLRKPEQEDKAPESSSVRERPARQAVTGREKKRPSIGL